MKGKTIYMCSEEWNKGMEWTELCVWLWDAPRNAEIKQNCAGWCVSPLFFNISIQKDFPLSLFLVFQWDTEDVGIWMCQGSFGAVTAGNPFRDYSNGSWCAAPFPHPAQYWELWNEKALLWILSSFLAANYEWEDDLKSLGFFLVFAYINWMISGSRLGLWHPVMILNWRVISGGKTLLFLLHIILTECIFLI